MGISNVNLLNASIPNAALPAAVVIPIVGNPIQRVDQAQRTFCLRGIRMIRECRETVYAYRYPIGRVTSIVVIFFGLAAGCAALSYYCLGDNPGGLPTRCRGRDDLQTMLGGVGSIILTVVFLATGIFILSREQCDRDPF